jgi:glycosyltransferase involved in cell wall biosynthesis
MSRVLNLIETSGPGGAENIMLALAEHQGKLGLKPTVCIQREGWVSSSVRQLGFDLMIKPLASSIDVTWLRNMYRYVKKNDVKLIHAHEFSMNFHGTLLSQLCRIPCITTVHGKKYYPDKFRRRFIYRYISKHSNLVAVSHDLKQFLINEININSHRISVLPNGIDISKFEHSPSIRKQTRAELGIREDQVLIGAIGNLYPVKGHTYLLAAAALVCKEYPEAVFLIAGRGELEHELKSQAAELGIDRNLLFLGFRDDVHHLLQAMDVFAMSSLSEGLPVSILEAMASKTPVVSTDVGGIKEVIKHKETGFLVLPQSHGSLAEGLMTCLREEKLRKKIVSNAYNLVNQKHSLASMLEEYEKLYQSLGQGGKAEIKSDDNVSL